MRNVLIAAVSLVALAGSASAAAKHTWFDVSYGTGACEKSSLSPEGFYNMTLTSVGRSLGIVASPISPENVTKDEKGNIHVHVDAMRNGDPVGADFFTSKDQCDQFVKDQKIVPEQAAHDDIN
jgi:hypothetical protein